MKPDQLRIESAILEDWPYKPLDVGAVRIETSGPSLLIRQDQARVRNQKSGAVLEILNLPNLAGKRTRKGVFCRLSSDGVATLAAAGVEIIGTEPAQPKLKWKRAKFPVSIKVKGTESTWEPAEFWGWLSSCGVWGIGTEIVRDGVSDSDDKIAATLTLVSTGRSFATGLSVAPYKAMAAELSAACPWLENIESNEEWLELVTDEERAESYMIARRYTEVGVAEQPEAEQRKTAREFVRAARERLEAREVTELEQAA